MNSNSENSFWVPFFVVVQILIGLLLIARSADVWAERSVLPKCLYVSSYHQGYPWSDGVERGLREELAGHCELHQFDMDTKRNKSTEFKRAAAAKVKVIIDKWRPDVVITSDDNAAKFLIKPFYRDANTPFVFAGVNWTVEEYGFPYRNVTGIIEVAPIRPLLEKAANLSGGQRGIYLGADTLTEKKNYAHTVRAGERLGLTIDMRLVASAQDWIAAYHDTDDYDFVVVGSKSGINDWDETVVGDAIAGKSERITVTVHDWMMPYTMMGYTKIPEEQGEWAAKSAIAILGGTAPADIPIVTNRKWDMWINDGLIAVAGIELPVALTRRAKKAETPQSR
ncbi:MAG TPA: hypothetical protein EYN73_04915 [Chromatiaceae bacterium]|jgi:hypothetical protein|nr:hypothetical protein [Chromatiaceae bacterium]HIA08409.1 hypothetical protein [Chromatiaceae bacterium]HIB84046.1 hypothetical protein [Chromatiaceae bacterium]HIN83068.1 hypothetical protein [Chromatiales bacterium]HIO55264.1 hypothetical protein [Chromatiales bacterium]